MISCNFACLFVFKITPSANESEYTKVLIPLALMKYRDFLEAQKVRSYCIHLLHSFIAHQIFKLCFFSPLGIWWRYAGEAVLSTSLKDRSEHRCHAADRRAHGRLGWLLEWGMWEVRWQRAALHIALHSCSGQVLSFPITIHRFESHCCVSVAESDSTSLSGVMVETSKQTVETSSSTPLSKWLSLLH